MKENLEIKKIINEAVKEAILEYDGGDDGGYGDLGLYGDGGGGYGAVAGASGKNSPAGIFLDPLLDIGRTALWGAKTLSSKLKYSIKALGKGLFAGLTPNLTSNAKNASDVFDKIKGEETKVLSDIDKEFAEVLKRNWDALNGNDVWGIAFLLNPGALIGAKLLQKAPGASIELLDSLTAGSASAAFRGISNTLQEELNNHQEATPQEATVKFNAAKNKLKDSPVVKNLAKAAQKILLQRAQKVLLSKTKDELSKVLNKNIDQVINQLAIQNKIPNDKILQFETTAIKQIKEEFRNEYILGLEKLLKTNSESASFIQQTINTIKQIKF